MALSGEHLITTSLLVNKINLNIMKCTLTATSNPRKNRNRWIYCSAILVPSSAEIAVIRHGCASIALGILTQYHNLL